MKKGKLYGVGVGPGDRELITLKALRVLRESEVIMVPVMRSGEKTAFGIVEEYIDGKEIVECRMPMTKNLKVLKENYDVDNTAENDENCGKSRIDGIFASSDLIAAQVLQVCSKLGIRVPEDIKLVGFDDVNISSLTTPRITTIHQPIKEIAELTLELLINAQDGKTVAKRSLLPVSLVKREST